MARQGWKYKTYRNGKIVVKRGICGSCGQSVKGMTLDRATAHYERCSNR